MADLEQHYEPEEPQDDDLDAVLSTVAAQGEGEILVKFYKFDKGRGNWIFDAHAVDMPDIMNRIKEEYGGGDYEAVVRRGNRIATRKRFSILTPTKPREEPKSNNDMLVALHGMKEMVQGMNQGFEALGRLIIESRQPAQTMPQVSQFEMMQQNLAMMLQMKQLFDSGQPKVDPTAQFTKTIELAQLLAESMSGEKSDPTPGQTLAGLAKDIAPVLTSYFANPQPRQPQPNRVPAITRPAAAIPAPAPASIAQPVQPANPQGSDPDMLIKMALQRPVTQLIQYAQMGVAAKDCAVPVLDQVPDAMLNKFYDFIMKPTALTELMAVVPAAKTHEEWFATLVNEIRAELTAPDDDTTIAGSETGIEAESDPDNLAVNGDS